MTRPPYLREDLLRRQSSGTYRERRSACEKPMGLRRDNDDFILLWFISPLHQKKQRTSKYITQPVKHSSALVENTSMHRKVIDELICFPTTTNPPDPSVGRCSSKRRNWAIRGSSTFVRNKLWMVPFVWLLPDEHRDISDNATDENNRSEGIRWKAPEVFTLQAASIFLHRSTDDGWQWNTWHLKELSAQWMMMPQ